jgi:hypothetical protein
MSRGSATLFSSIVMEDKPTALADKKRQGRSSSLDARRNEAMIDRYFYYVKHLHYNFEHTLTRLSVEFFISETTIIKVMCKPENRTYLHRLKQDAPTRDMFRKRWPHLNWNIA